MSVSAVYNPSAPSIAAILSGAAPAPALKETVGEHYRRQTDQFIDAGLSAVGKGLHFTAEAIPGVILAEMAAIKGRHRREAHERINNLPWDAQGKWKVKADAILAAESAKADVEIRNLPMVRVAVAAGDAIVTGATAVGNAIVDGASFVVDGTVTAARATGQALYDGGAYVADTTVRAYRATGRGFFGWLASLGEGLFGWATRAKSSF